MTDAHRGLSRRSFVKAAVAIGGSAALSACLDRNGGLPDLPQGVDDPATLPARQHAWNDALQRDEHGNVVLPRHHALVYLNYGDGTPTDAEREQVEESLRGLERAYQRGNEGLVFTLGYSPAYFERFDEALPESVDLPDPAPMADFEDPALDEQDALLHIASNYGEVLLAAEEALAGNREELNGVSVPGGFFDVFDQADRRTGFIGAGLPAEKQDVEGIPDDDPVPEESMMFMGFNAGFKRNQATEDDATITEGPFAGATTQHVSRLQLHLDQWYDQDSREQRVSKMFCPAHAEEGRVEGVGENLGAGSQLGSCPAHTSEDAREEGIVGHAQKNARARRDGRPLLLRRHFASTDDNEAGNHFVSLQEGIGDFTATRAAMNGDDIAEESAVGQQTNNGILRYLSVLRRGNFLIPPRSLRAFPPARPEATTEQTASAPTQD